MKTRTGDFAIGFRRIGSAWDQEIASLAAWAINSGFEAIDLVDFTAADSSALTQAKLRLGSVDLLNPGEITHPDPGQRAQNIARNVQHVKDAAALGAKLFFTIIGADPNKKRIENYRIAVESFSPIAEAVTAVGGTIAIEGYPGSPPHYALICANPETTRALLKDIPRGIGINYDPSHLIKVGIDHVRFLREFAPHVMHVHAKDTELFPDAVYELGLYQSSIFQTPHRWGDQVWRYAIPGHGSARWSTILQTLKAANYGGLISVELEDENFNGTQAGEKAGLLHALNFLTGT